MHDSPPAPHPREMIDFEVRLSVILASLYTQIPLYKSFRILS